MKVTIDVMLAYTQRNNDGMYTPPVTVESSTVSYVEKGVKKGTSHTARVSSFSPTINT
jgi:hypothetical protein